MLITIPHHCGHSVRHNLTGSADQRDRREAWLKTEVCRDCARDSRRAANASATEGISLPALAGSDKQVAWATDIRNAHIRALNAAVDGTRVIVQSAIVDSTDDDAIAKARQDLALFNQAATAFGARATTEASATEWINNRNGWASGDMSAVRTDLYGFARSLRAAA